jgi:hypothetical protein
VDIERSDEPIVFADRPDQTVFRVDPVTKDDDAATRTTHPPHERKRSDVKVEASVQGELMIRRKIVPRLQSAATKQQSE